MLEDFIYNVRTQFSFFASDRALAKVLDEIAEEEINITGYSQTKNPLTTRGQGLDKRPDNNNFVRLVPGMLERETKRDLRITREALEAQRVDYLQKPVIQVTGITPEATGVISAIYDAIRRAVTVFAIYAGEETSLILDVSDVRKALAILMREEDEEEE